MAENTIITLTSPDGATLNTAGTYCEGNIEVVPKLQSKTATTGEIVTADAGYVGLESVDTNPAFEAGKKSEYDAFWDALQLNGQRREYSNFGAGVYVPSEIWLNPKYPFVLKGSAQNFMRDFNTPVSTLYGGPGGHRAPVDLSGWKIDTSEVADAQYLFCNASVKNLTLDLSNATSLLMVFNGGNRGLSNNITLKVSEKCTSYSNAFYHNKNENWCTDVVRFAEGSVIAAGNLNLSYCNQSKVSLASVINALSPTTTGLTVTVRASAVKKAFETSEGANDGDTSDEWLQLIATKPNWTINTIDS